MESMLPYLRKLAQEMQRPESEVIGLAVEAGLQQLWRERALGRYLHGEISRAEAVEVAGIDWVELAERQRQAVLEDVQWALEG